MYFIKLQLKKVIALIVLIIFTKFCVKLETLCWMHVDLTFSVSVSFIVIFIWTDAGNVSSSSLILQHQLNDKQKAHHLFLDFLSKVWKIAARETSDISSQLIRVTTHSSRHTLVKDIFRYEYNVGALWYPSCIYVCAFAILLTFNMMYRWMYQCYKNLSWVKRNYNDDMFTVIARGGWNQSFNSSFSV